MSELDFGDIPLIVAPMAGGPSTPALVKAAAATGAFGFLAAGYKSVASIADEIHTVRATTERFGVNLFVPDTTAVDRNAIKHYRERLQPWAAHYGVEVPSIRWADDDHWADKLDLLGADPVEWVSFTFGIPNIQVIRRLHAAGSRVMITATDADEAELAYDSGADAVVAQSGAAGGHSSTTSPELYLGTTSTLELIAAIRERIPLPVIAAGGISSPADLHAVLGARAVAAQAGTMFLKADEAGTKATHRGALGDPRFAETVITRSFTGRPARALRNRFTDTFGPTAPLGYPAVHHLTSPIRAAANEHGDPHGLNLWAGRGFGYAREGSTEQIINQLTV